MRKIPWRLLLFLAIVGLAAAFAGLNLARVDVSVGFYVFREVPVFLALIVAYMAGAVSVLPFAVKGRRGGPGAARGPSSEETDR